jgi:DNA sulfur modification protein DndD
MWQLSKIILNNFRPYRDKKTIEFSTDKDRRITIILGKNGTGKTTLLNAITWCLYGEEYHLQSQIQILPILNTEIKDNLAEVSVELHFKHAERDFIFKIERKQKFERVGNKMEKISNDELGILYKEPSSYNWKREGNPNYFIQTLLPKELHDFYFFDGEKLDRLFITKEYSIRNVKETIEKLSLIYFIDNTIKHLGSVKSDITRNLKDKPGNLDYYQREIDKIKKDISEKETELDNVEKEIKSLEDKKKDIDNKLKEYEEIIQYTKERERLTNEKSNTEKELKEYESKFGELLVTKAIYVYCKNAIDVLYGHIENMYKQGKIPPSITPDLVKDLLNKNECICGRPLDDKEKDRLYNILKKIEPDYELFELLRDNPARDLINTIEEFSRNRDEYISKITNLKDNIKQNLQKLEEISNRLKSSEQVNIRELENKRTEYENNLQRLREYKGQLEYDKRKLEEEKRDLENKLYEEMKKYNRYKKERYKLDLIDNAIKVLDEIKEERKREIKNKVSEKTDKFFKQLIWKKGVYNKVIINNDYSISVLDDKNNDMLTVLSAGEREILALSFISAVREVINIDMPIIIDTPLARIDEENRENIAKLLPEYLTDTQMILLMTDTEYTKEISKILDNYVGKKLLLNFNKEEKNTNIEVI